MALRSESTNPLTEVIHERYIERPDSFNARKRDWHPVAGAVALLGSLLSQKGHCWNKGEKLLYRRAILSVKHPCCPTCGKPMNENIVTTLDGVTRKSWFCAEHQNL